MRKNLAIFLLLYLQNHLHRWNIYVFCFFLFFFINMFCILLMPPFAVVFIVRKCQMHFTFVFQYKSKKIVFAGTTFIAFVLNQIALLLAQNIRKNMKNAFCLRRLTVFCRCKSITFVCGITEEDEDSLFVVVV